MLYTSSLWVDLCRSTVLRSDLVALRDSVAFNYYFRHYYANTANFGNVTLQGWGVDLTLKSVEYKVMDEHSDDSSAANVEQNNQSPSYFHYESLLEEFPSLSEEIKDFKVLHNLCRTSSFQAYIDSSSEPFDPSYIPLKDLSLKAV